MVEPSYNTTGLGHTLPINPTQGRQQPRQERQDQTQTLPPPVEGIELPEDRVSLSGGSDGGRGEGVDDIRQGSPAVAGEETPARDAANNAEAVNKAPGGGESDTDEASTGASEEDTLDAEEEERVRDLKQRDAEVKSHEQAHMAAGGGLVQGAASYTYEKGPDGGMYAVGGEVKIDTSPAKDPDQTIAKMQQVRRAALAPAQPSSTDRSVAAQASQVEAQARSEKASETAETEKEERSEDVENADAQASAEESGASGNPEQPAPDSPFSAPAIAAYQAAAANQTSQQFSTFA